MTTFRRNSIAVVLFVLSLPLAAQSAPPFPIERIEVRGARFASASVVARESLLSHGSTYSEAQLRAAMARIDRLPFVLDSSFALEKGSERGWYVLVITIVETKPLFVEAAFGLGIGEGGETDTADSLLAGARWFLGPSSLVHVVTDLDQNYEAGITQYDLFGRPGYVSLTVSWTSRDFSATLPGPEGEPVRYDSDPDLTPRLRFGIPLFGDHSIAGSWVHRESEFTIESPRLDQRGRSRGDEMELAWVFDTTDDPILPASGTLWRTGVARADDESTAVIGGSSRRTGRIGESLFSTITRYHPFSERMSVVYGFRVSAHREEFTDAAIPSGGASEIYVWSPELGLTSSLWPDRLTRRWGDLRFEARASYSVADREFRDRRFFAADAQIVQRNVWGTLRLFVRYLEEE